MKKMLIAIMVALTATVSFESCQNATAILPNVTLIVQVGLDQFLPGAIDKTFNSATNKTQVYSEWDFVSKNLESTVLAALNGGTITVQNLNDWTAALNANNMIGNSIISVVQLVVNTLLAYIPADTLTKALSPDIINLLKTVFQTFDDNIKKELAVFSSFAPASSVEKMVGTSLPKKTITLEMKYKHLP